jgi:hypothetical protein
MQGNSPLIGYSVVEQRLGHYSAPIFAPTKIVDTLFDQDWIGAVCIVRLVSVFRRCRGPLNSRSVSK